MNIKGCLLVEMVGVEPKNHIEISTQFSNMLHSVLYLFVSAFRFKHFKFG